LAKGQLSIKLKEGMEKFIFLSQSLKGKDERSCSAGARPPTHPLFQTQDFEKSIG
jgi:hypothetical protein